MDPHEEAALSKVYGPDGVLFFFFGVGWFFWGFFFFSPALDSVALVQF